MVSIRSFRESDNATILDIDKLCVQGNEKYAWGVDKSPDFIARYKMYDNWSILVAEEEDKIAGWIGWTVKDNPIRNEKYAYIAEVMIHPEFRRRGIATKLVAEAEKKAKENGAGYIYCYIFGPNDSSRKMFENLAYSNENAIKSSAVSIYKKANIVKKYKIERINKNEINDVVKLINDYYNERAHFIPFTSESFEFYLNAIPAYGLNNFWVVKEDGNILACAGLWDCSVVQRMCFAKLPLTLKIMGGIFGFLSLFVKMPKIPAEGEYIKMNYITDYAFKPQSPDAMSNLIGYFNNFLFENKQDFLVAVMDPNDTLFEIMKIFKPQNEIFYLFAKAFEKELPKFSPLYIDIRDTIL